MMTTDNMSMLKKEVETVFGRKILSTSDCQLLIDDIIQFTDQRISLNTLRRVFELMKSEYQPSLNTLDILANYCGFSSYSDFFLQKENGPLTNYHEDAIFLNMLLEVFNEIEFVGQNEDQFIKLINKLINSLIYSPKLVDRFQRGIAKTQNGQKFYFETFVNYDNLSRYYGRGLKYYLREKSGEDAQLFGNSLLCLNSWLTLDAIGVDNYAGKVSCLDPEKLIDPYLKGRFFSTLLLEANSNGKDIDHIILQAFNLYIKMKGDEFKRGNLHRFEFVMAETLVLTGRLEEAFFYINEALGKSHRFSSNGTDNSSDLQEGFLLLKAIALAGLGRLNLSRQIHQKIKTERFHFLSKELYSILYFSLSQVYQRKKLIENQINFLIQQTRFSRLQLIAQNLLTTRAKEVGKTGQTSVCI